MSIEGRRIGRYQVLRRLGTGGMAEVYVAESLGDAGFRRRVALKVLRPHLRALEAVSRRFLDEATLAARLRHPNLVPVLDYGERDGLAFLAMDLVEGPDLRRATREGDRMGRPLPPLLAVHVAVQAARGLAYAHALAGGDGRPLGLVHRDVSPQNILLSRAGEVRLADFGIATAALVDEGTAAGALHGKVAYLAPEQVAGAAPDARADLFALGVVLWEVLAGRRLFLGATDAETLARVRACDVAIPPPGGPAEVPGGVWAALRGVLAADPSARTRDAGTVAAALAAAWPEADRGEAAAALAAWVGAVWRDEEPGRRPGPPQPAAREAFTPVLTPTLVTEDLAPGGPVTARGRRWRLLAAGALLLVLSAVALGLARGGPSRPIEPSALRADVPPAVPTAAPAPTPAPSAAAAAATAAPSVGPAPPVRPSAALVVTSRPAGAGIEVNGRAVGRTPRRLDGLAPGRPIVVVLRLDGHRAAERTVTPDPGRTETLDLTLEPAFGLLSLDAEPWAEVTLDGEAIGPTPIFARRVPAGRRSLRLLHPPSGASAELTLDVSADQHVRRRVSLTATPAAPR